MSRPTDIGSDAPPGAAPAQGAGGPSAAAPARRRPHLFVGRHAELRVLDGCVARAATGEPVVVSLEGVAGVGKTALLEHFTAGQDRRSVLVASGDEEESSLAWGVLRQLARGPGPHPAANALADLVARVDEHADPFHVGERLVEALGCGGPLVVVVDDAHAADPQSLATLRFALRRLRAEPVLVVVSHRPEDTGALASEGWRHILRGPIGVSVALEGLSASELVELAGGLGGPGLTVSAAESLFSQTGGHPLYVRTVLEQLPADAYAGHRPLPVPGSLATAVLTRLAAVDPMTRDLVGAVAVVGPGERLALVGAVMAEGLGLPPTVGLTAPLAEASAIGMLTTLGPGPSPRLGFSHPLVRAAVYHDLDPARRRALHLAAARHVHQRSLAHRVAASEGHDESLAQALEDAARSDLAGGHLAQAATRLTQALDVSPPGESRDRRLLHAVTTLLVLGEVDRARAFEAELAGLAPRPGVDYVLGYLCLLTGRVGDAEEHLLDAWGPLAGAPDAPQDPSDLAARVASLLAIVAVVQLDVAAMVRFGAAAVASRPAEEWVAAFAWFARTVGLGLAGRGEEALGQLGPERIPPPGAAHDGRARTDESGRRRRRGLGAGGIDVLVARGMVRLWCDDPRGAYDDLSAARARAASGEPLRVSQALGFLGEAAYRLGRLDEAQACTREAVVRAEESGLVWDLPMLHALACLPVIARGDRAATADHARRAADWAALVGTEVAHLFSLGAQVVLAEAGDDVDAYVASARRFDDVDTLPEPGVHTLGPVLADALVRAGRLAEAEQALARYERRGRASKRQLAACLAARGRGTLVAARGDDRAAADHLGRSASLATQIGLPLEALRARLALGICRWSSADRSRAVAAVRAVRMDAAALGAHGLAERADAVLGRWGAGDTDGPLRQLSPTEAAVARLVGRRLSNREVARRLAVSTKAVEYHLTRIYATLDVGSRHELAALLDEARDQI